MSCGAEAQSQQNFARIGFLSSSSPQGDRVYLRAFERGLSELGYSPGKDPVIDERYASGQFDNLPGHAAELIKLGATVLLVAGAPAALAARKATATLPIIFTAVADPIGLGIVASLARPGGNITGLADLNTDIVAKRLEILGEVAPRGVPHRRDFQSDQSHKSAATTALAGLGRGAPLDAHALRDHDSARDRCSVCANPERAVWRTAGHRRPVPSQSDAPDHRTGDRASTAGHVLGEAISGGWR